MHRNLSGLHFKLVKNKDEFISFIKATIPQDDLYIIKPNWFDPRPGSYTDAETLDAVFTALPGKKIVIEGHSHSRNDLSIKITPDNMDEKREWIRTQEKEYLNRLGIKDVLDKHNVEYINITEEWWKGKTVPGEVIKGIVESKFTPVGHQEFYQVVPLKLFELKGKTLIDLARVKMSSPTCRDFSLTMKNLFGLLPQPSRYKYHDNLPESIVDINKVYRALFNVLGLCEGVKQAVIFLENGKYSTPWSHFDVVENLGIVACSKELVDLDVFIGRLFNEDLTKRTLVQLARKAFGTHYEDEIRQAPVLVDLAQGAP
ncbi:MAG: DUF362 domain-containing protein [Zhaonellaceae bacterium]|jgi:uncharacterized protein (DUF362 family)|nr:DUF362 domain-containing protein [Clostridia bacterium]